MKKLLYLFMAAGVFIACNNNTENADTTDDNNSDVMHSAVNQDTEPKAHYGEKFSPEGAISTSELQTQMEGKDSMMVVVKAEINETCTKMGCWMKVENDGGEPMMVYMGDHTFFVPKEGVDGKTSIIAGKAFRDTVSVDMLQHYAEDAGKSQEEIDAITEPVYELALSATGVIIEDYEAKEEEDGHEGHDH